MAPKGSALKGALATTPKGGRITAMPVGKAPAPTAGLQRLSPGVYRNPQGQLVGSTGKTLPGQRPQQPQPHTMPGVAKTPQLPQQPQMQQPQYGQGMYYAGGSPNFNELTGQYNFPQQPFSNQFQSGLGVGVGAAFGGQPASMPQQQYDTGFYDYMKSRQAQAQPLSAEQQAATMAQQQTYAQQPQLQGMVATQQPMYKGNVY